MDRRVTIEQPPTGRDDYGAVTGDWTEVATVWAGKRDIRGSEFFADRQHEAQRETTWRIRYRTDVTETMRLTDDEGVVWDIQGIAEIGRREGLDLMCTARDMG